MDIAKVGFIGCGGIANWHFGHFEKMTQANVVATCDLIEERAQRGAERLDARPYTDYEQMLEREDLDAVYICVEPSAHDGVMEQMVIDKGCHLFVQKPMALSLDYVLEVRDALEEAGLIGAVGFQCRYANHWPRVRAWIDMHDVAIFSGYRLGGLPGVWWWRQREHSGGQIIEQAIHNYDLCRMLFGEVLTVHGMARDGVVQGVENYDVDDCSAVTMHFESGVVGTMFTGCFSQVGGQHNWQVFAPDGRLEFAFRTFTIRERNTTIQGSSSSDPGQAIDETFIDAVRTGDPSDIRSPYADACETMRLTLAAQASIDHGGVPIDLSEM